MAVEPGRPPARIWVLAAIELAAAVLLARVLVGSVYWFAVLRAGTRVPLRIRRAVLVGGQEVAAFIGLLSLFGAWGAMNHDSPLGLAPAWDQCLGGVYMMVTCAAVAVPILRNLV